MVIVFHILLVQIEEQLCGGPFAGQGKRVGTGKAALEVVGVFNQVREMLGTPLVRAFVVDGGELHTALHVSYLVTRKTLRK